MTAQQDSNSGAAQPHAAQPSTAQSDAPSNTGTRRSRRGNLAILAFGELLTRGMSFLAFAHLARTLGTDGFGKLEFVLAWVMLGVVLIESGFQTIGARDVAIKRDSAPGLVARIVPIQICIAALAVAVAFWIWTSAALDDVTSRLLVGYSLSLLATPFFLTWVFQGQQRMPWIAIPQVARQLCFLTAVVLLVRTADDIGWLPYAESASVLVAAALCLTAYLYGGQKLRFTSPLSSSSRSLSKGAATIGASQLLWFVRMYFPIVLLKFVLNDEAVGRFGAAHRIVNVFQVGVTVYWLSFFPLLSQHAGLATLQRVLLKSLTVSTLFMTACATLFTLFAPQIMQVAYGTAYSAATGATILAIMVWRVPIIMLRSHARQALFVNKYQRVELVCSLASVAVLVVLSVVATHQYGIVGLAIAATVSELAGAMATWAVWLYQWHRRSWRSSETTTVENDD